MKNKELAQRIKGLRIRNGYSQEELAEKTGLSLRTIQRVENGETDPRGDSLKRIAFVFGVNPDEIMDWTVQEDKGLLTSLNLSALTFMFFPILGILVPLIIWISKKDKIRNLNDTARELLNFQITWTLVLFVGYIGLILSFLYRFETSGDISIGMFDMQFMLNIIFVGFMYASNLILIIVNSVRLHNDKTVVYFPKINFLKKDTIIKRQLV